MPHRHPPRLPSFDYRGCYRYFVTCCVYNRKHVFINDDRVACVRTQVGRTCDDKAFELLADVYMPDHVHLLVEGCSETSQFVPFMTLLRQRSAVVFKKAYKTKVWQDGYHERVLRNEETSRSVIEYMFGNPVRAGLVQNPSEYPYVWSRDGFT